MSHFSGFRPRQRVEENIPPAGLAGIRGRVPADDGASTDHPLRQLPAGGPTANTDYRPPNAVAAPQLPALVPPTAQAPPPMPSVKDIREMTDAASLLRALRRSAHLANEHASCLEGLPEVVVEATARCRFLLDHLARNVDAGHAGDPREEAQLLDVMYRCIDIGSDLPCDQQVDLLCAAIPNEPQLPRDGCPIRQPMREKMAEAVLEGLEQAMRRGSPDVARAIAFRHQGIDWLIAVSQRASTPTMRWQERTGRAERLIEALARAPAPASATDADFRLQAWARLACNFPQAMRSQAALLPALIALLYQGNGLCRAQVLRNLTLMLSIVEMPGRLELLRALCRYAHQPPRAGGDKEREKAIGMLPSLARRCELTNEQRLGLAHFMPIRTSLGTMPALPTIPEAESPT
ncbi:hypothetical protein [Xylophilus sp. GOD-11R]|uniref:hypothetical protein n=1 Tax=Xylophilus sp. GOD-11R TaxID=3089814 RepID=UPI00298C4F6D|nr:hypothetical protein [Xylophilus sp. GOD-11R]WPB56196.1 hypothetical protein R9X41_18920 [Xylophilus sp. GOD-11R]